jgi:predicted transposase YdaD
MKTDHPDRPLRRATSRARSARYRRVLRERDQPNYPSWARHTDVPLRIVPLDRFLPEWLEREPENPFVAVFAPLVIEDDAELRALAPTVWRRVNDAPIAPESRALLSQVLEFWFIERFRDLSAKEIWAMLNALTPLEETHAYQSIYAEGKTDGITEGKAEGKAEGKSDALTAARTPLRPPAGLGQHADNRRIHRPA